MRRSRFSMGRFYSTYLGIELSVGIGTYGPVMSASDGKADIQKS